MAIYKITLNNSGINNPSLQVGDYAFYQSTTTFSNSSGTNNVATSADNPIYIGPVGDIGINFILVESTIDTTLIYGFLMFSKDKRVNNDSLNGYYAEVTIRNNDSENASEMFAINTEVVKSSK